MSQLSVRRLVGSALVPVALAAALSACSVAGTDFRPGVAVEVDGASLSSGTVDEYASYFCEAIDSGAFGADVGAVARGELRRGVAGNLARKLAAEQFAADYAVTPGSYYDTVRAQSAQTLTSLPEDARAALVDVQSADAYVNEVALAAGEQALAAEGREDVKPAEAQDRGAQLFASWLSQNGVEIDPSIGITLAEDGSWVPEDASTSTASSSAAVLGLSDPVDDTGQPNPEYTSYVKSLPDSQRCGG